ncbi:unnamed protein product [Trifolium pratense]|uniref:Uncharacterized protein n=1 Tax=Trifolium pratense TaxID=57577 RepID=A0ACB0LLT5_TRIPR|nr:unnamed protein product [Trifolium pratense]
MNPFQYSRFKKHNMRFLPKIDSSVLLLLKIDSQKAIEKRDSFHSDLLFLLAKNPNSLCSVDYCRKLRN